MKPIYPALLIATFLVCVESYYCRYLEALTPKPREQMFNLGQRIYAESLSQEDIAAAIDKSKNGDRVFLPSGTSSWNNVAVEEFHYVIVPGHGRLIKVRATNVLDAVVNAGIKVLPENYVKEMLTYGESQTNEDVSMKLELLKYWFNGAEEVPTPQRIYSNVFLVSTNFIIHGTHTSQLVTE